MQTSEMLTEAYSRVAELVHASVRGLDPGGLIHRPAPDANPIAWLIWHLTRVQDDHIAALAGREQLWVEFASSFGMEPDTTNLGMGHTSAQVGAIVPDGPEVLLDYFDAVHARSAAYLGTVEPDELDRIVDRSWDPPVTAGVRIVSVLSDNLQHAGQARYLRGIIDRLA